ncbi:MAG: acetoacetate decarboxylase family protein [Myxococcota bacterium]
MLSGSADPEAHLAGAPTLDSVGSEPVTLREVEIVQVMCEAATAPITQLLPPALHPTIPGVVSWLAYRCPESPWGPFQMVQTRIQCRCGNRPRAFLLGGMIDSADAASALSAGWGYRLREAEIFFRRSYASTEISVHQGETEILSLELSEPALLPVEATQFVSGMHPAMVPDGSYRLIQCDARHTLTRAERATSVDLDFSSEAWGSSLVTPLHIISGTIGVGEVTLTAPRYAYRPGEFGLVGAESLGSPPA